MQSKNFFSNSKNKKIYIDLINQLNIADYANKNEDGIFSNKRPMFTGVFKI